MYRYICIYLVCSIQSPMYDMTARGRMSFVYKLSLITKHNVFISYRSATNNNSAAYMWGPFYIMFTMRSMISGQQRIRDNNNKNERDQCLKIGTIHYHSVYRWCWLWSLAWDQKPNTLGYNGGKSPLIYVVLNQRRGLS